MTMAHKRSHDGENTNEPPAKVCRALNVDRLSRLSDELLLRVLSFVPVTELNVCQRLSHKFRAIAADSQLWKAAYYNRFVLHRARRIPGIRDTEPCDRLSYSSKFSKWLDEEDLVKGGEKTNWKNQYKLRHNWSRGKCVVSEIPVAERPPVPPLLVRMHNGIIYTADTESGLRAWSSKDSRELVASVAWKACANETMTCPTALAVDSQVESPGKHRIAVGFDNGSFGIWYLARSSKSFELVYAHPASSNGTLSSLAYSSPYLLTMTEDQLLSLYFFSPDSDAVGSKISPPELFYSLRSHTVWPPLSLAIRTTSSSVTASIAYALPTYLSGWTVGIQEMRLSLSGELLGSRLATATENHFHSLAGHASMSSPSPPSRSPSSGEARQPVLTTSPVYTKPTSLSYSHPYLLVSHPDNTLTLYLVTSTTSSLSIGPGSRLWGHTSSVSGAYVGGRGKAVSVSRQGNELRVWELEGGMASSVNRKRLLTGELSVRVQPEKESKELDALTDAIVSRGSGLGLALEHRFDDLDVTRGWVGFDEESVIVLQEKSQGSQALVVYDFT